MQTKWKAKRGTDLQYPRVIDQNGDVVALVVNGSNADASVMAAAPELLDRLSEVRHLKSRTHDGRVSKPLLPSAALVAIDAAIAKARKS